MTLAELLKNNVTAFEPVVPFTPSDKIKLMDFSANNPEVTDEIVLNEDRFVHYMYEMLESGGFRYAIGGYDENREIYGRSRLFDGEGNERRLHLGIDIWGRPHTKVMAPLDALVHSKGNNNGFGDYGATIILSHQLEGVTFHTLYGHLSLNSLKDLEPGDRLSAGDVFAEFGMPTENGHWPPHLHFQIIEDLEGHDGDYPGVCSSTERDKYLNNCPDPDLILRMLQHAK